MSDDGVQAASIQRKKVMTKIIGASRAQEKLLQEILSGLGSETQIQSVYVKPAGDWDSGHPDSVLVDPHIAPTEVVRGDWGA